MKHLTTLCLTLFLVTFAYAEKIPYQFIKDSFLFDSHEAAELYEDSNSVYYHENKHVICGVEKNKNCFYETGDWHWISQPFYDDYPNDYVSSIEITLDDGQRGFARLDDLKNLQACESIHIDLNDARKQCWVFADTFEIVNSKSQDFLLKKEPYWVTSWMSGMGEDWQDDVSVALISFDNKSFYMSSYASSNARFLIESCANNGKDLEINLYTDRNAYLEGEETYISKYSKKGRYKITVNFDGDYLRLYDNDSDTYLNFAYTEQYDKIFRLKKSIARNETVDFSEVLFPRHADGTCDYDSTNNNAAEAVDTPATEHTKSSMEAVIQKPAPVMRKTAVVTENLRLRTGDKATAQVVTTLAAGTRVKVLAPGREDTIDGITANWAQVSVLDGAKDKDGNVIEAGTIGWLFGGYLTEAETAESESANEEASTEKESSALPIVPIAAGGAALAVLLAVVIFAIKKRKYEKK